MVLHVPEMTLADYVYQYFSYLYYTYIYPLKYLREN